MSDVHADAALIRQSADDLKSPRDRAFALDLLKTYDHCAARGYSLKAGTIEWLGKMADRIRAGGERPAGSTASFPSIIALFDAAHAGGVDKPAALALAGSLVIRLGRASPAAKEPGSVFVTGNEQDPHTGERRYFGKIARDGRLVMAGDFRGTSTENAIVAGLTLLVEDGIVEVARVGKRIGKCPLARRAFKPGSLGESLGFDPKTAAAWGFDWPTRATDLAPKTKPRSKRSKAAKGEAAGDEVTPGEDALAWLRARSGRAASGEDRAA